MTRTTPLAVALGFCGLLVFTSGARAQEISVEQLVAMALERSPELQAARTEIGVVSAQVTQAALRPNPMLAATQEQGGGGTLVTTVGMEWPLDLFRRPARLASAERAVQVTSLSVRDRERLVASAVREQAGRLLAAQRTLDVTNESLTAARRMRDLLERRVTEGGTTRLDANLAAVEAMRLEAEAAIAAGDVAAALVELKATVGLAPDAPLMLADSLEVVAGAPVVPRLTPTAALEARPDLREAIARIASADARAGQAREEARTDVTLTAGYTRMRFGARASRSPGGTAIRGRSPPRRRSGRAPKRCLPRGSARRGPRSTPRSRASGRRGAPSSCTPPLSGPWRVRMSK
ncbi:MAG: TolC family protein [Acidobacteria bacterium]|nr:TolC family protein [Acidobacteriota bacterium]